MTSEDNLLYENEYFQIEHAIYYRIAGFLFVKPRISAGSIQDLSLSALVNLGSTLKLACSAIESVLSPINIYCTKFGESGGDLHFHVFPRTSQLTELYAKTGNSTTPLDGPHLMSWANRTFTGSRENGNIATTINSLRHYFSGNA